MTHSYNITGMTCSNCIAKAKKQFLQVPGITEANLQLSAPQATINMQNHIPLQTLQSALHKAGNYTITGADGGMNQMHATAETASWLSTYKPILIIGVYITLITLSVEAVTGTLNWERWMQNFMAAFFLVFSFFKMLDLKGFAESYSTYDVIAKRWHLWGYIYAFIELALGIAYLSRFSPLFTNAITFVVMTISIAGILQSVLNKRKIKCACLGAVFNLPMSTVTIIEDALMIAMSLISLSTLL